MKEFLTAEILKKIVKQKQSLITLNPELQNFFMDIFLPFPNIKSAIPFLPIRCFRDFNLHLENESPPNTIFYSSGSTNNIQAKHIFSPKRLELYATKSCEGFERFLKIHNVTKDTPIISLIPPKEIWNKSSLAAMVDMLKSATFNVHYYDIENNSENIAKIFLEPQFQNNLMIFGTSFHHLLVAEYTQSNKISNLFKGKKLLLIDTGGTKGRTQSFTLKETIQIFKETYGNPKEFLFLSEYGMCELASQAWSVKKIHDGTFICNETLTPIVINIRENTVLRKGEYGFLGFFDLINMDSWPTLITEDIACIVNQEEGIFHLKGRAPDATLKGCSLNVKESFFFLNTENTTFLSCKPLKNLSKAKEFKSPEDIHNFIETLNPTIWTPYCWTDLSEILITWNEIKIKNPEKLKDKNILIISSANIPITWVYPTRIASLLGAKSIHIKLPSLRSDDPIANKTRKKVEDLVEKLSPYFYPTQIILEKSRTLSKEYHEFDIALVFGTNTTITTFKKLLTGKNTHLIPQGDVKNSLKINPYDSAEEVAKLCSLWHGRGCLTPICLFMSGKDQDKAIDWIQEFQLILENNFLDRFKEEGMAFSFIHETQLLYTKAIVKNVGLEINKTIFSGKITHVFNLTKLTADEILHSKLDFSFGGSGFVFVLDESVKTAFPQLSFEKILPTLQDKHGGKTWEEWFNY